MPANAGYRGAVAEQATVIRAAQVAASYSRDGPCRRYCARKFADQALMAVHSTPCKLARKRARRNPARNGLADCFRQRVDLRDLPKIPGQ